MNARRKNWTVEKEVEAYNKKIDAICDKVDAGKIQLRKASSLALVAAKKVPLKEWNFLSVMGKLLAAYEVRFHAPWPGNVKLHWEVYEGITQAVARHGIVDFLDGVDLVFSPEMKWVEGPIYAILKEGFFIKVVLPRLLKHRESRPSVGEQAEARGGRDECSSKEVVL